MLLLSIFSFSQPGFDEGTGIDEPTASINGFIYIVFLLGIIYVAYKYKNKK
jgi:hypothetical protein